MLGNGRLEAMCFDSVKRLCHIRGKLRKKVSGLQFADVLRPIIVRFTPISRCGSIKVTSSWSV